ncbi:MAG: phospho-sugar mutase [Chlamydiae bacterium]|nr:phospho-sugar mutase [Chlamydiota bacterium]
MDFPQSTKKNIEAWLSGPYDDESKNQVRDLLKQNPKELIDPFYKNLSFGTGGIREIMGIGTNRLNVYTIRAATQGLANYLIKHKVPNPSAIIGFDNRKNSQLFAKETAKVLSANGFKVYLFKELRPTPLVSFGCRHKKCSAAIMITASHNPPEYNGYKVFWADGGQVLPPHDIGIIEEVEKIQRDISLVKTDQKNKLIEEIDDEIDKAYLQELCNLSHCKDIDQNLGKFLKIVYTNLHGAGITMVPKALKLFGFSDIEYVKEQTSIDGNFPFAKNPNPEEKKALELGINLLIKTGKDILLATDPDADRVAVAINHKGAPVIFSGNELACIILDYLTTKKLPINPSAIKTIVTSELFKKICLENKIFCFDVLTGFKYIAEKIRFWEKDHYKFILGAEESLGYLTHTFARDKDSISTSCLIAEIALMAKKNHKTLLDVLFDIYKKYGIYREKLISISFANGSDSMSKMEDKINHLRHHPLKEILGRKVVIIEDYQKMTSFNLLTSQSSHLELPKSNVLRYWLEDGTKIVVRPSGTEPKIKIYIGVSKLYSANLEKEILECDNDLEKIAQEIKKILLD